MDPDRHVELENARVELRTFIGGIMGTTLTRTGGNFDFQNVTEGDYDLIVQLEGGRELKLHKTTPAHVFAAGALPEGRHQLRFEA